jgi:hypothetical protein
MNEEIGTMAGAIWDALEGNDGIGWLAREDKIDLARNGRSRCASLTCPGPQA